MAMAEKKTHILRFHRDKNADTLCGRISVRIIPKSASVDTATCKACQRADDALVVRNHRRECKEAGLDPDTMEPLERKHA